VDVTKGGNGSPAAALHICNLCVPWGLPEKSTNFVSATAHITCREEGLSAGVYSTVLTRCMANLAPQAVVSLERLVDMLTRPRDASFAAWGKVLDVLANDIANTMHQADELKGLFEAAGFRNCHLKNNPPSVGFQQLEIHGFRATQAGSGPELVATILVVIPQDAGDRPCRRVADCLKQAKALASRSGTWVFVVVIDVGKLKNKSSHRSFGTPPAS
jgi:hypothetical protein